MVLFYIFYYKGENLNQIIKEYSPVNKDLPNNILLLNMELKNDKSEDLILRFFNFYEKNESNENSLFVPTNWISKFNYQKFDKITLSALKTSNYFFLFFSFKRKSK
jgi:hypothetical protein